MSKPLAREYTIGVRATELPERDCIVSETPPLHISQNALGEKNGINRADFEKEISQEKNQEKNQEMSQDLKI